MYLLLIIYILVVLIYLKRKRIYELYNIFKKDKIVIIYVGESFRVGNQGSRNIGDKESYDEQIEAIKSHCDFMNKFKKEKNIDRKSVV